MYASVVAEAIPRKHCTYAAKNRPTEGANTIQASDQVALIETNNEHTTNHLHANRQKSMCKRKECKTKQKRENKPKLHPLTRHVACTNLMRHGCYMCERFRLPMRCRVRVSDLITTAHHCLLFPCPLAACVTVRVSACVRVSQMPFGGCGHV